MSTHRIGVIIIASMPCKRWTTIRSMCQLFLTTKVTTPAQDRLIRISHLRDRFQSARARTLPRPHIISSQTVCNRLHAAGFATAFMLLDYGLIYITSRSVLTHRCRQFMLQWATQYPQRTVWHYCHRVYCKMSYSPC